MIKFHRKIINLKFHIKPQMLLLTIKKHQTQMNTDKIAMWMWTINNVFGRQWMVSKINLTSIIWIKMSSHRTTMRKFNWISPINQACKVIVVRTCQTRSWVTSKWFKIKIVLAISMQTKVQCRANQCLIHQSITWVNIIITSIIARSFWVTFTKLKTYFHNNDNN